MPEIIVLLTDKDDIEREVRRVLTTAGVAGAELIIGVDPADASGVIVKYRYGRIQPVRVIDARAAQ